MRPIWLYTELKNAPTLKTYSAAVDRNVPGHYFAETFFAFWNEPVWPIYQG